MKSQSYLATISPRLRRGLVYVALAIVSPLSVAAVYVPEDDSEILLRIPADAAQARNAASRELPLGHAVTMAKWFIQRSRATGDPRLLGYAQATLAPWWSQQDPPDEVLLLRATIHQSGHDFASALSDLDALLQRRPDDAQAWLTRATVLRVTGRYAEARESCSELAVHAQPFISELCSSAVLGLSGNLDDSRARLERLGTGLAAQPRAVVAWYLAERADMAVRAGDDHVAAETFARVREEFPKDMGLLAAHADWLLARERDADVLEIIPADIAAETLLMRRAVALLRLDDPAFSGLNRQVEDYFQAARLRQDQGHLREEAMYRMAFGDWQAALPLAQQNWVAQREPDDARLLLEAANHAGDGQAVNAVCFWIAQAGLEDVRITSCR